MNNAILFASAPARASSSIVQCEQDAAFFAFNRLPSRYLHQSWRPSFVPENLADFLFEGMFSHRLLSDYMRQESRLDDVDSKHRSHPAVRVGTQLDAFQMEALCRRIGVALIGQPIRLAIDGKEIAAWISALGEPLFRFACRYVPLLDPQSPASLPTLAPLHPDTAKERTTAVGQQFLSACSLLIDASIGQRLRFKLPREIPHRIDMTIEPTHYSEAWRWIDRIWNCMPMPASPSPTQKMAESR
ncbi:MAG TPA: SctK family type III secretion system sorting platform protein [Herbaspirillum sp.]|jgi:hypothetical protein